jgi:flagellar biogenesis protein FliO
MGAIVTVVGSLAVALGLFWACAWAMRRGLPNNARRLPAEVVDVLGRAPLAGRQQMHVLRFGNKLLLVCISAGGVDTLGEITDPAEIDRVAGLCEQQRPQSATTAFKQIFGQLARERSPVKTLRRKSALAEEAADV